MSLDNGKLFAAQVSQALNVVSVSYFEGVMNSSAKSALPPADNQMVNPTDYRKAFNNCPVLFWGEDNKFPTNIDEEAQASSVFEGGMKILCDHMRGQDFTLALPVYKDGKRYLEEVEDTEVMDELEDIGYYEYWYDACGELPKWGNLWPIYRLNEASREIRQIKLFDGGWNRFEKPQPKNGKIENIFVSAQWPHGIDKKITKDIPENLKPWVFKYPLLDRYTYAEQLANPRMKKYNTFASHVKYHTSGAPYGRAPWHSLYKNRWLGISGKVPEMIIRYYEAAMTINYLMYVNSDWLLKKFVGFEEWDDDKKAEKIAELQKSFEKNLSGTGNALKSLMLTFNMDQNGKEVKNINFEVLDNKMREGNFIPDSQVSDGQILFTLGVAPSLIGAVIPGGKGGEGGSGSNIREASLAMQMRLRPDRELCHNPFYVWRDYKFRNTTDRQKKKLVLISKDYLINTLDKRAPASGEETMPTN